MSFSHRKYCMKTDTSFCIKTCLSIGFSYTKCTSVFCVWNIEPYCLYFFYIYIRTISKPEIFICFPNYSLWSSFSVSHSSLPNPYIQWSRLMGMQCNHTQRGGAGEGGRERGRGKAFSCLNLKHLHSNPSSYSPYSAVS